MGKGLDVSELLVNRGQVKRVTASQGSKGQATGTFTNIGDPIAGSCQLLGASEVLSLDKLGINASRVFYAQSVVDVTAGDVLDVDSVDYRVTGYGNEGGTNETFGLSFAIYLQLPVR